MYFKLHFKSQFKYMTSLYRHQNLLRSYNYMKYVKYCGDHSLLENLLSYSPFEQLGSALNSDVKLVSFDFSFFLGWPAKVSSQKFHC